MKKYTNVEKVEIVDKGGHAQIYETLTKTGKTSVRDLTDEEKEEALPREG